MVHSTVQHWGSRGKSRLYPPSFNATQHRNIGTMLYWTIRNNVASMVQQCRLQRCVALKIVVEKTCNITFRESNFRMTLKWKFLKKSCLYIRCRTVYAFQVTWSERVCLLAVRLVYVNEMHWPRRLGKTNRHNLLLRLCTCITTFKNGQSICQTKPIVLFDNI